MGYSHLQHEVCRVTGGLFISYFIAQRRMVRVGGELNFVVREGHPPLLVVPDLYILEDEPQSGPKVPLWKPAEHEGKVPTLAVEVVSDSYQKDYDPEEALSRYQELGVLEVVRYDPDFAGHRRTKHTRRLLTHFRPQCPGGVCGAAEHRQRRPGLPQALRAVADPPTAPHPTTGYRHSRRSAYLADRRRTGPHRSGAG